MFTGKFLVVGIILFFAWNVRSFSVSMIICVNVSLLQAKTSIFDTFYLLNPIF
jgi:type III secretory pathway component EscS